MQVCVQTVCAFWIKGMCMKGDNCGFLHEMIPERMPECNNFLKRGVCNDQDCPFKHSKDGILECNMYALGFCIYGPECRYKHTRRQGPPPPPEMVEAAKPKAFRDINRVVNSVNKNVVADVAHKRPRCVALLIGPCYQQCENYARRMLQHVATGMKASALRVQFFFR